MIMWLIRTVRNCYCAVQLANRVRALEKRMDATAYALDRLDERDADLRARQDEFAKV